MHQIIISFSFHRENSTKVLHHLRFWFRVNIFFFLLIIIIKICNPTIITHYTTILLDNIMIYYSTPPKRKITSKTNCYIQTGAIWFSVDGDRDDVKLFDIWTIVSKIVANAWPSLFLILSLAIFWFHFEISIRTISL